MTKVNLELLVMNSDRVEAQWSFDVDPQEIDHAVAVARTSASASFDRGLTEHSNFSGVL